MNISLKIKCPNAQFSNDLIKWKCEKCKSVYIYGFDHKLYCECGGSDCNDFTFNCADPNHPSEFSKFNNQLSLILDKYYSKYSLFFII